MQTASDPELSNATSMSLVFVLLHTPPAVTGKPLTFHVVKH